MANDLALEELRREGYIPWSVDRRLGPFVTCDLFLCADILAHWPNGERRDRLVQACQEDMQSHVDKFLKGYSVDRMRKNKETGLSEIIQKTFPPNPYLKTLLLKYEFYIYGFGLRRKVEGRKKMWTCRKWKAILSPEGQVSFEKEESE